MQRFPSTSEFTPVVPRVNTSDADSWEGSQKQKKRWCFITRGGPSPTPQKGALKMKKTERQRQRLAMALEGGALRENDKRVDKHIYKEILHGYQAEVDSYESAGNCGSAILEKVTALTADGAYPNPLLTATASMLMVKLSNIFKRYKPIVTRLLKILLDSIYTDPDRTASLDVSSLMETDMYAEVTGLKEQQIAVLDTQMRHFNVTTQMHRRVLSQVVSKWQSLTLCLVFTAWRKCVPNRERLGNGLHRSNMGTSSRRNKLQAFLKWKNLTITGMNRKYAESTSMHTQKLDEWLRATKIQLEQREKEVAKLKDARQSLKKKNEALLELLDAERTENEKIKAKLHIVEGKLSNFADLISSTMLEVDSYLDDIPRLGIEAVQDAARGRAQNTKGVNKRNSIKDLEGMLAAWLSNNVPTLPAIHKRDFHSEVRTFAHLHGVMQLMTRGNITNEKITDTNRQKLFLTMYNTMMSTDSGLQVADILALSDEGLSKLVCEVFVRFTHFFPTRVSSPELDTYGLRLKRSQLSNYEAVIAKRGEVLEKLKLCTKWQKLGWMTVAHAKTLTANGGVSSTMKLNESRLRRLLLDNDLPLPQDLPSFLKTVETALGKERMVLGGAYLYYRAMEKNFTFKRQEWMMFVNDAKIVPKTIPVSAVENIYSLLAFKDKKEEAKDAEEAGIHVADFMYGVVVLVCLNNAQEKAASIAAKLQQIGAKVAANTTVIDTSFLQKTLVSDKILDIVKQHKDRIRKVHTSIVSGSSSDTLKYDNLCNFLRNSKLFCTDLPLSVFVNSVVHYDSLHTTHVSTNYISFKQFTDVIVAAALAHQTNPLLPVHHRVATFITKYLSPAT